MPSTAAEPDSRPPVFLTAPAALTGDTVVLDGPEGRHAATVRRLAVGERADLTDGAVVLAHDGVGPGARRDGAGATLDYVALVGKHAARHGLRLEAMG